MRRIIVVPLLAFVAGPVGAQRADSANVARASMRAAATAMAAGDTAAARAAATRAAAAWPTQGAYLLSAARLAAMQGDGAGAASLLERAAAMGFAPAPHQAYRTPGVAPAVARAFRIGDSLRRPLVRSSVVAQLPDTFAHIEGVARDTRHARWLVTSVRHGRVLAVDDHGRVSTFADGLDAAMGIAVDTARGLVWVTTARLPQQAKAEAGDSATVVTFDLASGARRGTWTFPSTAPHFPGDVVIAPDGRAWITDSRVPGLWTVDPSRADGLVRHAARSAEWQALQGIAFDARGTVAWVADWTTGLYRVDVATGSVEPVDAVDGITTLGIDGLYRVGDRTLVAVQNGVHPLRVVRLRLDDTGRRVVALDVLERAVHERGEPTLGVLVGTDFVYSANSPWDAYDGDGRLPAGAAVDPPVLRRLPLGRGVERK